MRHKLALAVPIVLAVTFTKVKAEQLPVANNTNANSNASEVGNYSNNYEPKGVFDTADSSTNVIKVTGWAFDQDNVNVTEKVEVYLDDNYLGTLSTNSNRPDVNNAYGIQGIHGFIGEFQTSLKGSHVVSIYAVDLNEDNKVLLGQKTINIQGKDTSDYDPQGWIDSITSTEAGSVSITGWVFDLDTPSESIKIRAYISNKLIGEVTANDIRDDVNQAYTITGLHGFSSKFTTNLSGVQTVSLYGVDPLTNQEKLIGSKQVTIKSASSTATSQYVPQGNSDLIIADGEGGYYVAGWAFDKDVIDGNIQVNIYNNNQLEKTLTASQVREDVNKAYNIGGNHGYSGHITTSQSGNCTIKITLVDPVTKQETLLTTQSINIKKSTATSYKPEGCLDIVNNNSSQSFYIAGWAYDLDDLNSSVAINIYANDTLITTMQANQLRDDVNQAKGITGNHGYSGTVAVNLTGKQTITAKMVDLVTNKEYLIGSQVLEFQKSYTSKYAPIGCIDILTSNSSKQVTTSGWAFDQDDLNAAVEVEIYEGNTLIQSISANKIREDLNQAYKITGKHGFEITFNTKLTGEHTFTYKMKDLGTGKEVVIGTKKVIIQNSITSNFDPVGCIDGVVSNQPGEIKASGWIFDQDDLTANCKVNIYEGSTLIGSLTADRLRSDVNGVYKITGNHGFSGTIQTKLYGKHDLTFKMVDLGTNKEYILGTRSVEIQSSYSTSYQPIGVSDLISYDESGILSYSGWVFDQDDLSSNVVLRIYDHTTLLTTLTASKSRVDVNQAYHITGNHGYSGSYKVNLTEGSHTILVKALDLGTNKEYEIGSKTITVKKNYANSYSVKGCLDSLTLSDSGVVSFTGWAFDQDDLSSSVEIRLYDGSTLLGTIQASDVRDDVNQVYKITGKHGFSGMTKVSNLGINHTLTVKAKELGSNSEVELGQKTFKAAQTFTTQLSNISSSVMGCVDYITAIYNKYVRIQGWCYDASSKSTALKVKVICDGVWIDTITCNTTRTDVNSIYGLTGVHGFVKNITLPSYGSHQIELVAVDANGKDSKSLATKNITATANSIKYLDAAFSQLGTVGGTKYNQYCGLSSNSSWCAAFVSWCANQSGVLGTKIPMFTWVDNGYNWYNKQGLITKTNPKAGYIIFFDYADKTTGYKDGIGDHVGFVVAVDSNYVYTIEGNHGTSQNPLKNAVEIGCYPINSADIKGYGIVK